MYVHFHNITEYHTVGFTGKEVKSETNNFVYAYIYRVTQMSTDTGYLSYL